MIGSAALADEQGGKELGVILACGGSHQHGVSQGQEPAVHEMGQSPREEGSAPRRQELCPVLGGKVNPSVFADYEGRRIHFCCPACVARFMEEPAKYMKEMQSQGIPLERTPQS